MSLNADQLFDRLQLKAQLLRWRVIAIIAVLLALIGVAERHSKHSPIEGSYVARLNIEGIIQDDPLRDEAISDLQENRNVKAVIVWLDTPGGTAVGGEELYYRLKALAQVKPVVAVMRSMATSAGYMTALAADHIIAREGTITGSIGVIVESFEVTELAKKLGVEPITVKSAPLKGSPSMVEKLSPEGRAALQDVIDDFYQAFVDLVVENRKIPRVTALKLADGRVYSGHQALERKLIDEIGGEDEAMEWLEKEKKIKPGLNIRDVEIAPDALSPLEEFTGSIARKILPGARAPLDGLAAVWHPALQ